MLNKKNLKKKIILFLFYFYISISFSNDEKRSLLIFAPASLRDALEELVKTYELDSENIEITNVFLGTSQLAKQIYHGAKPDIFISANKEWMDYLEDKSLIVKNLRFNYLTNSLVIITNQRNFIKKNKSYIDIKNILINTESRLSLALVNAVPAGIYAKQTLRKLKIWKAVRNNLAQSSNVRTAMQFVSRGDLEYGIVYKSDVIASKSNIEIIFEVEKKFHDEIVYPVAPLNTDNKTIKFYKFLSNEKSFSIMKKWGFKKYIYD